MAVSFSSSEWLCKWMAQVSAIEAHYRSAFAVLAGAPGVAGARIRGSVAAVEMSETFDIDAWRRRFIGQGVFIRPIGRTFYLAPANTIDLADLSTLTTAIVGAVNEIGQG